MGMLKRRLALGKSLILSWGRLSLHSGTLNPSSWRDAEGEVPVPNHTMPLETFLLGSMPGPF